MGEVAPMETSDNRPRKPNLIMIESSDDLGKIHDVGQISAVRWLDDNGSPQWYIVVIVGQTDDGYEVRWKEEIYKVDLQKDEVILRYNQNVYGFLQRYPQASSITVGQDVYLFAHPDETIGSCIDGINLIRLRRNKPHIRIEGVQLNVPLERVAEYVPNNKIIFG